MACIAIGVVWSLWLPGGIWLFRAGSRLACGPVGNVFVGSESGGVVSDVERWGMASSANVCRCPFASKRGQLVSVKRWEMRHDLALGGVQGRDHDRVTTETFWQCWAEFNWSINRMAEALRGV